MENLEKVELIREKCNVSYEEAREALEACDYDVLEAVIAIERKRAEAGPAPEVHDEEPAAEYTTQSRRSKVAAAWSAFCDNVKQLLHQGMETTFVAERNDERVLSLPVLFVVLGLFVWGATLWLLVIGLFFGFRYHIEGVSTFTVDVNEAMSKAADVADDIKSRVA